MVTSFVKTLTKNLVQTADFDKFMRLIVYLVIIFLLLKLFKIL
ncbi:MAG: hypothetical protein AABX98_01305 [Nanoarchaeota archaeon]